MNVTRDVITDLWPLYQSGEASTDTRRLIEEYLQGDEAFARMVSQSPEESLKRDTLPPLKQEKELEVLRQVKRQIRVRDALFWFAVVLTPTPLTVWDTSWGKGWLIRDFPWVACGLGALAALVWVSFFAMKRRLSGTGL